MTDAQDLYRQQLRAAERRLPSRVETELVAARQRALAQRAGRGRIRLPMAAGGLALASVLALVTLSPLLINNSTSSAVAVDENRLEEDLDFYYWLAETRPAREG